MDLNIDQDLSEKRDVRPTFLTVLCILSFITLGFSVLTAISQISGGPLTKLEMAKQKIEMSKLVAQLDSSEMDSMVDFMDNMMSMTQKLNDHFYGVLAVSILTIALGFFGVLSMWRGSKLGFHLYIIYSLIGTAHVYIFVSPSIVPSLMIYTNLGLSAIFVFMYSRNLKWMK